jgi:hypothetical protein
VRLGEGLMEELKPCPFCGKNVAHVGTVAEHEKMDIHDVDYDWCSKHYDVVCDLLKGGCGASTGKQYETPREAIEAWNRRASDV